MHTKKSSFEGVTSIYVMLHYPHRAVLRHSFLVCNAFSQTWERNVVKTWDPGYISPINRLLNAQFPGKVAARTLHYIIID